MSVSRRPARFHEVAAAVVVLSREYTISLCGNLSDEGIVF